MNEENQSISKKEVQKRAKFKVRSRYFEEFEIDPASILSDLTEEEKEIILTDKESKFQYADFYPQTPEDVKEHSYIRANWIILQKIFDSINIEIQNSSGEIEITSNLLKSFRLNKNE